MSPGEVFFRYHVAMQNRELLPHQNDQGICFTFEGDPSITSVAVAGTFNSWVGTAAPLLRLSATRWQTTLQVAPGRHHYKYVIDQRDWILDPANPWISEDAQNNSSLTIDDAGALFIRQGQVSARAPSALHRRHAAVDSPQWLRDAVIYQLSVRAFGRTFDGLRARLDYLQDLGVNVVWMMPIHPIGEARRLGTLGDPYAVRDFLAIDPALGDAASLRALVGDIHARGMRIIFDWTLNRASVDNVLVTSHPEWFARGAQGEPVYLVPNRDHFAGFDFSQRALRDWLLAAMQGWVRDFDLDGMRFDDADITPTDFLEEIRAALQAVRPDIGLISQSLDELHHIAACDLTYDGSVRALAAAIARGETDADGFRREWEAATYSFPRGALRMRWLDEKEQGRAFRQLGPGLHRAAATVQLTLDGVPHLLMGQEFNEPRWRDWTSLYEDFEPGWDAFDEPTFGHYRALLRLRGQFAALRTGGVEFIDSGTPALLAYWRGDDGKRLLVLANLSSRPCPAPALLAGMQILHSEGLRDGTLDGGASVVALA